MNFDDWMLQGFDKADEVALVTGASSGIGLEYLRELTARGCRCIAVSNDGPGLESARASLGEQSAALVETLVCDLADPVAIERLAPALAQRPIGILINNAGFGIKGDFVAKDAGLYRDILNVNALAPTLLTRALLPRMLGARRGLVVHVASINVLSPIAKNAVYTATKAYLLYYAYAVAAENRDSGVRFQIVLPGTTATPFHDKQGANPKKMVMTPDMVVARAMARLDEDVHVSNKMDRLLYPVANVMPLAWKTRIASYLLKVRLGV